ncbi:MAG: ribosome recycling factor [Oligoflexia bacterium]|nr:ribosome recycling factor [Oligoflexia bacterium]MBF0364404.1 ribosome recycling factor [Oligoflexia bacterium]
MNEIKSTLNESMDKILVTFKKQLSKMRTGRATPTILEGVMVNYYGTPTPVNQVGQISTPDARMLQIQPFDKSILHEIEKSVMNANLGVTPTNDGNFIRIPFPPLTEDKRKVLVKDMKKMGEESKVNLRNIRRDQNERVKKAEKGKEISEDESKKYQNEVQQITDSFIEKVDKMMSEKEKELLTV